MTVRRAFTVLFKLLVAVFLGYCIVTTIQVWIGGPGQKPQLQEGSGWVLLWCSVALSILRRWIGPIGKGWDLVHEIVFVAAHVAPGIGLTRPGSPPPSDPEGE